MKMKPSCLLWVVLSLLLLFGINSSGFAQIPAFPETVILPAHEADRDPSFKVFYDGLKQAIRDKDVEFIKRHLDETILFSYGEDAGSANFIRCWKLDANPGESGLWEELERVLRPGGVFENPERTIYSSPYTFHRFPTGDPFDMDFVAVLSQNVRVHAAPKLNSKVVTRLSYHVVKWLGQRVEETIDGETIQWMKVQTAIGTEGFIAERYIWTQYDYRVRFELKNGDWKMVWFIAGD